MKTLLFVVLAVGVVLGSGEAVGQSGPPNYQHRLSWQKYSPWGAGGQLEMKVDLTMIPGHWPPYMDFTAATWPATKADPNFYHQELGYTTSPYITTTHTFNNWPSGGTCWVKVQIEVQGTGTGQPATLEVSASL